MANVDNIPVRYKIVLYLLHCGRGRFQREIAEATGVARKHILAALKSLPDPDYYKTEIRRTAHGNQLAAFHSLTDNGIHYAEAIMKRYNVNKQDLVGYFNHNIDISPSVPAAAGKSGVLGILEVIVAWHPNVKGLNTPLSVKVHADQFTFDDYLRLVEKGSSGLVDYLEPDQEPLPADEGSVFYWQTQYFRLLEKRLTERERAVVDQIKVKGNMTAREYVAFRAKDNQTIALSGACTLLNDLVGKEVLAKERGPRRKATFILDPVYASAISHRKEQ